MSRPEHSKDPRSVASFRLLTDVSGELAALVGELVPVFGEIDREWKRSLRKARLDSDSAVLGRLTIRAHARELRGMEIAEFRESMERTGRNLSAEGIPEEHALSVLLLYAECAVPYVCHRPGWVRALLKLVLASQLCVHAGYNQRRAETWRSMDNGERHRLTRDLHDEVGHNLLVLKLYLEMTDIDLREGQVERVRERLAESLVLVTRSVESIRRLILDLGPAILDEVGFKRALKLYTRQFTSRTGIEARLAVGELPSSMPPAYEVTLYRTMQGALSNVLKHSGAKHVTITLGSVAGRVLVMTIEDDGRGFDTTHQSLGFGLRAIRERIEILGGRFHLNSRPQDWFSENHGTRLEIDIPIENI